MTRRNYDWSIGPAVYRKSTHTNIRVYLNRHPGRVKSVFNTLIDMDTKFQKKVVGELTKITYNHFCVTTGILRMK